jgi:hypothetical protein
MTYERLLEDHDRIDRQLARLTNVINDPQEDAVAATLILSDLSEELRLHLAHEDSMMYRPIIAAKQRDFIDAADRFCQEFDALRQDWERYLVEWTTGIIRADWAGFRASTQSMIKRLDARVRAENELLYVAALQAGIIPLREPVAA